MFKERPTGIHGWISTYFATICRPTAFKADPDHRGRYLSMRGPLFIGKNARARAKAWLEAALDGMVAEAAAVGRAPKSKPRIFICRGTRYISDTWLTPAAQTDWNAVEAACDAWLDSRPELEDAASAALEVRRNLMIVRHGLRDRGGTGSLLFPMEGVGMRVRAKALKALEAAHKAGHISAHELLDAYKAFAAAKAANGMPAIMLDSPLFESKNGPPVIMAA